MEQNTSWQNREIEIGLPKIERLKSDYQKYDKPKCRIVKNIIHNFSSFKLTPEEELALSFSLDDHIPTKQNDITSIDNISRNKDIILIKQDKGRGVWWPRGAILKFENKN